MRGFCYPSGFVLYEQEEIIMGIEDLSSLAKFGIILISTAILSSVVQAFILQIALFILMFICLVKVFYYEWSEWHAVEHRLIYLLENNCPLTMDSFKKIPIKHERCGIRNKFLTEPSTEKMSMAIEAGKKYLDNRNK